MELAAANRRLTTAILGMTLLIGLVACLSYLAGRTVTHIRSETATVVRTEIPPGPVVVQPLAKPSPSLRNDLPPANPTIDPAPGLYFQVGLVNPAVDRTMQERLAKRGFAFALAPMENSSVMRLLVGPIESPERQREIAATLAQDGFQYFPRRY